ncbi:MAG TPA: hypothetical protein VFE51_07510 [Verrucomicrobiae bacterium]|nr:hypothetical protein [Verrucomicrobiae bacterium]
MPETSVNRRDFIRVLGVLGGGTIMAPFIGRAGPDHALPLEQLVRFPEKTDLILRTDSPRARMLCPLAIFNRGLSGLPELR